MPVSNGGNKMICGIYLMVGSAIFGIVSLFVGNWKWILIFAATIVLGAFLYYDLPMLLK
jgi:hypothetical protein